MRREGSNGFALWIHKKSSTCRGNPSIRLPDKTRILARTLLSRTFRGIEEVISGESPLRPYPKSLCPLRLCGELILMRLPWAAFSMLNILKRSVDCTQHDDTLRQSSCQEAPIGAESQVARIQPQGSARRIRRFISHQRQPA